MNKSPVLGRPCSAKEPELHEDSPNVKSLECACESRLSLEIHLPQPDSVRLGSLPDERRLADLACSTWDEWLAIGQLEHGSLRLVTRAGPLGGIRR